MAATPAEMFIHQVLHLKCESTGGRDGQKGGGQAKRGAGIHAARLLSFPTSFIGNPVFGLFRRRPRDYFVDSR